MKQRVFPVIVAVTLLAGCASSSSRPAGVPAPELNIVQTQGPGGSGVSRQLTGPVSVRFQLQVLNTWKEDLILERVELESVGEGAYSIRRTNQAFEEVIPARESGSVEMWATGVAGQTIAGRGGPVTIRATFYFTAGDNSFREVITRNIGTSSARW